MEAIFCPASSIHFPKSLFSATSPWVQKSATTTTRSQLGFPRSSTPIVLAKGYHSPMPCVQGLMGLRGMVSPGVNTLGILGGKIKNDLKRFASAGSFPPPNLPGDPSASSGFLLTGKEALERLREASKQRDRRAGLKEALEMLQKASKKREVGNIYLSLKESLEKLWEASKKREVRHTDSLLKEALKKLREASKGQEDGDMYSFLKSVSLELVTLGMGDTAVTLLKTAMNEEQPAVQPVLFEVLIVEALICQGKYEEAAEKDCLKDPTWSNAACQLYRAVLSLLRAEKAEKEWEDFKNSVSFDLPVSGNGPTEDTSIVEEFADFKTIVDNLKKAIESNTGRGKKNS